MTTNPFEAPAGDPFAGRAPVGGSSGGLDAVEAIKEGFSALGRNVGPWIATAFVAPVIYLAALIFGLGVGFVVLGPVLVWGGIRFLLNTVDGQAAFGDNFAGFSRFGQALGGILGWFVLEVLIGLPGSALSYAGMFLDATGQGSFLFTGMGTVLQLVWFGVVTSRLSFAPFYVVDQGLGPVEAMKASWEATREHKLAVILLYVLMVATIMAGFIALLVGVIPAGMVVYSAFAAAYRQVSGTAKPYMDVGA